MSPVATPSLKRVTVDPFSPVPVNVGVVSLVLLSVSEDPVSEASVRFGVEGASGVEVSKVYDCEAEVPRLPAVSRTSNVIVLEVARVTGQLMADSVTLSVIFIKVDPLSIDPQSCSPSLSPVLKVAVTVWFISLVMKSVSKPVSDEISIPEIVVVGDVESMVTSNPADAVETLPAASV